MFSKHKLIKLTFSTQNRMKRKRNGKKIGYLFTFPFTIIKIFHVTIPFRDNKMDEHYVAFTVVTVVLHILILFLYPLLKNRFTFWKGMKDASFSLCLFHIKTMIFIFKQANNSDAM